MSQLHTILADFERGAEASQAKRTAGDLRAHAIVTSVRRRHRARMLGSVAAASAAALVVTGTVWAVLGRSDAEPAVPTPTPSASAPLQPSPSASPSPSPQLSMPAFAGTVTVDEHLPSALPITPEVWNEAGPGWVLATYRETLYLFDDATQSEDYTYGPQVAYLVSPDGARYELTSVAGEDGVAIVAWDPQASAALAIARGEQAEGHWVVLDLVTGTSRAVEQQDVTRSKWTTADLARQRWPYTATPDAAWEANLHNTPSAASTQPTSSQMSAALAAAQVQVPATDTCKTVLPLPSGGYAVGCGTPLFDDGVAIDDTFAYHYVAFVDANANVIGSPVATTMPETFTDFDIATAPNELTAFDGGVRLSMAEESIVGCPSGVAVATPEGVSLLAGVESLRATDPDLNVFYDAGQSGTALYTMVTGGCSGDSRPAALMRDEPASRTFTTLIPLPAWWLEATANGIYPAELPWPVQSIVSAYVVPDSK